MMMECPLWVISGHVRLREKASALPLKADILGAGQRCPLNAIGTHRSMTSEGSESEHRR